MGEFFFWPQLPQAALWLYTTDPKLLVAIVAVAVAVFTTALTYHAIKWAASDETFFPQFSREAQRAREDGLLQETIMGLRDNVQGAPHAGAASRLSVGEAHADRPTCEGYGCSVLHEGPCWWEHDSSSSLPADRSSRGVA